MLNIILYDDELEFVQWLIIDLYDIGVDVLIVQDMGILELDILLIEFYVSIQCDICSVEKVKFFVDVGFLQIVLVCEFNLSQIVVIYQVIDVMIEFFIYGVLCVVYFGQCYIFYV